MMADTFATATFANGLMGNLSIWNSIYNRIKTFVNGLMGNLSIWNSNHNRIKTFANGLLGNLYGLTDNLYVLGFLMY